MSPKYKTKVEISNSAESSTRDQILARSLEMINTAGMVDFRIDTLAASLGLSPGNITYHFSRKEEICVSLWGQYLAEYGNVQRQLTSLIDIKQLYLINRTNIYLNYKYRGVVMFRSSDIGALERDQDLDRHNEAEHDMISERVMTLLNHNGYVDNDIFQNFRDVINNHHYMMMRWGINMSYMANDDSESVSQQLDMLSLLSLHALYPTFNEKGRAEFEEILAKVEAGDLEGSMI